MFLKKGMTIGLVAPSLGITEDRLYRYDAAKDKIKKLGYKIVEAPSVLLFNKGASNTPAIRAKEFMDMYLNPDVDFIMSVAGGELLMEVLDYIDFGILSKAPKKLFMGYSDNTNLSLLLLTKCNIKSVYSYNFLTFGMKRYHKSVNNALKVISGEKIIQESFNKYELEGLINPLDGFNMTKKVTWKSINGNYMEGNLIGGCLDCISVLVGTKYDYVRDYIKDKKVIWYFDVCDYNVFNLYRALWQLKSANYFNDCNGIIISRFMNDKTLFDVSIFDAINNTLGNLNIPIFYDTCIGHLAPMMSLINGNYAKIYIKNNKGYIEME